MIEVADSHTVDIDAGFVGILIAPARLMDDIVFPVPSLAEIEDDVPGSSRYCDHRLESIEFFQFFLMGKRRILIILAVGSVENERGVTAGDDSEAGEQDALCAGAVALVILVRPAIGLPEKFENLDKHIALGVWEITEMDISVRLYIAIRDPKGAVRLAIRHLYHIAGGIFLHQRNSGGEIEIAGEIFESGIAVDRGLVSGPEKEIFGLCERSYSFAAGNGDILGSNPPA